MNQNDTNKRIAKACGWRSDACYSHRWVPPGKKQITAGSGYYTDSPPNYTQSLDAIREAVLAQDEEFQQRFADELVNLCIRSARVHHQLTAADWCAAFLAVEGRGE